jgi:triosephosphate isomerase
VRKPIVAGNWKMNKHVREAGELAENIKMDLADCRGVDVVLCPPFTSLQAVGERITGTHIKLGAQNMHWENNGAYTGEVSPPMLRDMYCHYVILGHSERRAYFYEANDVVNRKLNAALNTALRPIMCVGETKEQREAGKAQDVVKRQLEEGMLGISSCKDVIIAYEPVWAIGTGLTATPGQAQEMHAFVRKIVSGMFGDAAGAGLRIQYGGSVKPGNAAELFGQPDIDGGLIGGAALEARSFVEIVRAAM